MRRIVASMWTTLDGYVADSQDEMPWLELDEQMMEYEISLVNDAEALLLGRVTHGDFAGAWPSVAQDESEPPANRAYAQRVDEMPKFVVSRSGATAAWANSSLVESLDKDTVTVLKRDGDGDLVVYGSLSVIAALRAIDMIDEYHLLVHPTTVGKGKALFPADQAPARLHLRSVEPFPSGVVLMRYSPAGETAAMTATTNEIHGTSRLVIRDGKLEEFKRLVAQAMEVVRTKDPGTIEYNVYLNAEGTEAFVHERFRDSAAGMAHSANIASLMQAFLDVATITGEVCGNPAPELRKALEAGGVKVYTPLQALSR